MHQLDKLIKNELVQGLPKLKYRNDLICDACQKGKQTKSSFKSKTEISSKRPLELLHMDLMGPARIKSLGGNLYTLVIVDDFSRFTWTIFLASKSETYELFTVFAKRIQNEKGMSIVSIRTDHGGEFENGDFATYCENEGINHNFSAPRTPQQNGVVERKNRVLADMARAMMTEKQVSQVFWADALSTACYISNRAYIRSSLGKTPYELFKGRKPNLSHLHIFGSKCFIHNNGKDNLGKFDPKSDEGLFLGYSNRSKAYRVFNKRTCIVEESVHVVFVETNPPTKSDVDEEIVISKNSEKESKDSSTDCQPSYDIEQSDEHPQSPQPRAWKYIRNHPIDQVIGEMNEGVRTRKRFNEEAQFSAFISQIEPKNVEEALTDNDWIIAMEEELNQFERNQVWDLVPRPNNHPVIGSKWVFRNKLDESGIIVRNKARLVAKGYNQEEGIDYDETYAPVARLEAIRVLLAFACLMDFKLFQMDVKSAFLTGFIMEEVYVEQPQGFANDDKPNHVYKLKKALYGLKQAPRAWYERLSSFLINKDFVRGKVDTTLFIKHSKSNMLVVQIYVDDIIFGATNNDLCQ